MSREATFIGGVSKQTGFSIHTIRFYESKGLLPETTRSESGYRVYSPADIEQLQFIRKAQEIGFSLDEIRELLVLRDRDTDACSHVKSRVEEKLANVRAKIQALESMERDLKRVRSECSRQLKRHRRGWAARCPVLMKLGKKQ